MNENLRDRFVLFGIITIITFIITYTIGSLVEGLITLEPFIRVEMYYFIFLLPFIMLIFLKIDLSNKKLLDDYLYLVVLSILIGLFLADFKDFIKELITYLKSDEIILLVLYIFIYIYLIIMFQESIKLKTKKRND